MLGKGCFTYGDDKCPLKIIELIEISLDNLLEARSLIRVFFDSYTGCSNCECNEEVLRAIIYEIEKTLKNIDEIIIDFNPDCFDCLTCATYIEIEEIRFTLRNIIIELCEVRKIKPDRCKMIAIRSQIEAIQIERATIGLTKLAKKYMPSK